MMIRTSLALFLGLLSAAQALPAQDVPGPTAAEIAVILDSYYARAAEFGFSGAVLIAEKGEVLLNRGYGWADRGAEIPLTAESPFHIGSVGKQFTAAAILRLEADGKLSTEDRLDRFFPDAPEDKRSITLHQLLTHTSGLPYLTTRSFMEVRSREEVQREMLDLPLEFDPGSRYAYSNPGYTVLAGVIERASGESYEQYVERAIFEPAGLESTGFINDVARWESTPVQEYGAADDEGRPLSAMSPLPKALGAGSIVSTVQDLYRWDRALLGDGILSDSQRMRLVAPAAAIREGQHYGYGWMITRTPRDETLIHHAGDLGGYSTDLRRYAEPDLVMIVSSNARVDGRGYRTLATNALAYLLNGQDLPMPPVVLPASRATTSTLTGEYETEAGGRIIVTARSHGLTIGGTGEEVLLALGGNADSAAVARSQELSHRTETIADFDADFRVPMEQTFLPTGPDSFASHDLFNGRTVEARFETGSTPTLTITSDSGRAPLTAVRIGGAL